MFLSITHTHTHTLTLRAEHSTTAGGTHDVTHSMPEGETTTTESL